jgi:hypothetical protein
MKKRSIVLIKEFPCIKMQGNFLFILPIDAGTAETVARLRHI